MQERFAARCGRQAVLYRIVIRGQIVRPLVGPLEGMSVAYDGAETVFTGGLVDQAHLHGALNALRNLGVELVSVNPVGGPVPQEGRPGS